MSFSTNRPLGVPEGGTTNQALIKLSNADYDVGWGTGSGGGGSVTSVFTRTGDINAQTGDYNSDQVTELVGATNLYFTNARAIAAFSNTAPISYSSGVYSIAAATTSVSGYLSSSDWTTFNNKGTGTVTSVALSVPSWLTVSGAVTTTGTLAITATSGQTANYVMATPDGSSGAMSLRALVANDIPNLNASKITSGFLSPAQGGCGVPFYGDGSDGNVTISGSVVLLRDMYYNNLTITGAGNQIVSTAGYRIFVAGTLDITGAVSGAIQRNPGNGNNASGATGGTAGTFLGNTVLGGSSTAPTSGTTATTGTGTAASSIATVATAMGGVAGTAGAGGALGAVGVAGQTATAGSTNRVAYVDVYLLRGASLLTGGFSGTGGSSGNGNGTSAGGGGGAGGVGGSVVAIFCNILKRDNTTATNAISYFGSNGGNGGNAVAGGGGGGGAGAGGGCIYFVYNSLQGSTGTNIFRASGGAGGNGGTGTAGYYGGTGGQGGNGGRIILINASTGVVTETDGTGTSASTPTAPTGTAGTAGTAGVTIQASL